MTFCLNSVIAILLSLLCPSVLADDYQFNGLTSLHSDEIKAALIHRSVTGISPERGFSFTVFYPSYGKLEGEAGPWGLYQDKGVWSVKENIYCAKWDKWLDNKERCYRVYLNKGVIYWVTLEGILQSRDTLIHNEVPE